MKATVRLQVDAQNKVRAVFECRDFDLAKWFSR